MSTNLDGLRIKSPEAVGGGEHHPAVASVAKWLQKNTPGGVRHFAAFNDRFHHRHRPRSLHTKGLAGDATFNNPREYASGRRALREHLKEAGLGRGDIQIIDHHARRDAPAHLHFGFKTREAADRYERWAAGKPAPDPSPTKIAEKPAPAAPAAPPPQGQTPAKSEKPEAPKAATEAPKIARAAPAAPAAQDAPKAPAGREATRTAQAPASEPASGGGEAPARVAYAPRPDLPFVRASFADAERVDTTGTGNPMLRVNLALDKALTEAIASNRAVRLALASLERTSFTDT